MNSSIAILTQLALHVAGFKSNSIRKPGKAFHLIFDDCLKAKWILVSAAIVPIEKSLENYPRPCSTHTAHLCTNTKLHTYLHTAHPQYCASCTINPGHACLYHNSHLTMYSPEIK